MIYLSKEKLNNVSYVANLSGGKDSLAMTLRLMEEGYPLTHVVFYDTGMEFRATYNNISRIRPMVESYGAQLVILKPGTNWLVDMLIKPVRERGTGNIHYGYEWCGGCTRWRTSGKTETINKFLKSLGNYIQYIGIATDEPDRIKDEANKCYPLVEWKMTEKDCLHYCYEKGFHWQEDGVELYNILKRVSCWCCGNKNLEELRNMYHYLPYYWELLKGLQSRIDRPFYGKYTVFELEERFRLEDTQMSLFDFGICDGTCGICGGKKMKYIVEATEKKTLKEVTLEVNGTSKEEVVKAVTEEGYDTKRIESADTHHVCKYCHGIAEGKDEELLCSGCRELFGHTFYSEL